VRCQEQRVFFPTGLGMAVMGKTLWDRDAPLEEIARDYFISAFGEDGEACLSYLRELSRLFDPPYIRGEKPKVNPEAAASFARIPEAIARFQPVIHRNLARMNPCHARSWHYLDIHAALCLQLALALQHRAQGHDAPARSAWESVKRMVQEKEDDLQPVLDVYEFIQTLQGLF